MPKTFTDDVALVLPSAIDGPFLVVDPTDASAFIQVDPSMARVLAAGSARPTRRIPLGFTKTVGTSTASTLGTAMASRIVAVGVSSGYLCGVFGLPSDMDLAAPSRVKVMLASDVNSILTGKAVRIELTVSYGRGDDSVMANLLVNHDWMAPDAWNADDVESVTIDDGSGDSISGNTFEADDFVGIRLRLARAAAEDTFDRSVHLAVGAVFEYTANRM